MLIFSVGTNSDGEVDSDKEDGDETDKKNDPVKTNSEGNSEFILMIKFEYLFYIYIYL